jgi:hypothetical protein
MPSHYNMPRLNGCYDSWRQGFLVCQAAAAPHSTINKRTPLKIASLKTPSIRQEDPTKVLVFKTRKHQT